MSSPAILLPDRGRLFWTGRVRGLLKGLGYAVTLNALLLGVWTLQASLDDIVRSASPTTILRTAGTMAGHLARGMFPGPLLMVIGVNLAPRAGVRRLAWLLAVVCLCALWAQLMNGPGFQDPSWPFQGLADVATISFVITVCAYHSQVEGTADRLLRTRIERATLDAELKRAQLQLLRAQIEPHFLFNTLSAVRALASADRAATVEMLDNLIRYFEAALPNLRQEQAPLAEEMHLIDAYLGVYRVRMGVRLAYEVTLPRELADIPVPTMMLLTLVENAIKHGVNPAVEGGFIRVSATRDRASLLLKVADSGRGMSARHGRGVGLANVSQRLIMLYGDAAVLSLAHAEPRGVVATISIPLRDRA